MLGHVKAIIAGGAESMSMVPMGGNTIRPNTKLSRNCASIYMGMGHTAEQVATNMVLLVKIKMHLQ